ncbi:MAG: hypothetical protein ACI8P9_005223 [Parasphingorhabdus sp.]|jgi:hypothetical protein
MLKKTLKRIISIAIAFIVFGFIDNFLMIVFGDRIDAGLVSMGITNTLFAAGLGNTLSDAVGILSGRWVEKIVHIKLPPVEDDSLTKNQIIAAETMGIIIGCLIGMFPLFFL